VHSWALAGAGALVLAALPTGVAGAGAPHTWVVHPGQSIQAAVDHARSGDTVRIEAGTYEEAVCVDHKGLTVVGAGRGRTTITWPAWSTVAQLPTVAPTPCWTAEQAASRASVPGNLADDVSGLFFLFPDGPVSVSGLTTQNHPADGIVAWGAHGFAVSGTAGIGHGRNGVLAAASTRTTISGNVEQGVARPAAKLPAGSGISVADSDGAGAKVSGNRVTGYAYGIYVREARGGSISGNTATGNCAGIRLFDDSATQIPDATGHVAAGDWKITGNASVANNQYCIVDPRLGQRTSGVGVAVISADHVTLAGNTITGNHPGPSPDGVPADFGSGGLVLVSLGPVPIPGAVDPGPVQDVTVKGNTIRDNQPFDVLVARPTGIPGSLVRDPGPGLVFRGNDCGVSNQPSVCGS
jgi:parallel beta-helix repeat protein